MCDTEERQNRLFDRLLVHSDDPVAPELVIEVQARVEPLLALTSRTVDLKLAVGEQDSQEVRLNGRLAMSARLAVEAVDPPGPDVVVVPAQDDRPQGLRLTVVGSQVGRAAGQVRAATGLAKPKELTLLYSWQVIGNLTVDPTNPYIDLRAPPPIGVVVKVSSSRPDFRLDDAWVVEGPFEASFARDEPARGYSVRVQVDPSRIAGGQRGLSGTLRLVSNDPSEPRKDVPLFALGSLGAASP